MTVQMQGLAHKSTVLAEPVKPKPCNKCGEPVALVANTAGDSFGGRQTFHPVDVVISEDHPGKVIPRFGHPHFLTCAVARLEQKREGVTLESGTSADIMIIRARVSLNGDTKQLSKVGTDVSMMSDALRAKIRIDFPSYEVVGWSVSKMV